MKPLYDTSSQGPPSGCPPRGGSPRSERPGAHGAGEGPALGFEGLGQFRVWGWGLGVRGRVWGSLGFGVGVWGDWEV